MDSQRDLLLYVDDEEQALKYFNLTFAKDYEVLTATGADQAWSLIERHADRLALVISDQRMPGRSGVDLLTAVKERCPRAVRLLTTAFSDLASAIAAVNRGAIYAYITKPWKMDDLRTVVRQALQLHHVQCERDALLAEKMSVFQHILLADRSRSLGMAMAALTGQARRPLAAAAAWLRDRSSALSIVDTVRCDSRDLWPSVLAQSRVSASLAGDLGVWLADNRSDEAPADVASVLAEAAGGAGGAAVLKQTAYTLAVDRRLLAAGFAELFRMLRGRLNDGALATVTARSDAGAVIISLRLVGAGPSGADPDRAGLAAYLAIHHHGGSISIPAWSSDGGQVEVVLGGETNNGLEDFLARLADGER